MCSVKGLGRLDSFILTRSSSCFVLKYHLLQLQFSFSLCRKNEKQNFVPNNLLKMFHVKTRTAQVELSHPDQPSFILKWNACSFKQNSYPLSTLKLVCNCGLLVTILNNASPPVTSYMLPLTPQKPYPSPSLASIQCTAPPLWRAHRYVLCPGLAGCQIAACSSGSQCMSILAYFASSLSNVFLFRTAFPKTVVSMFQALALGVN